MIYLRSVSGQRVLAAVTALTVAALTLGAPPLALTSSLVAAFGRLDRTLGVELKLIDGVVDRIVRLMDDASSDDLRLFLRQIHADQGGIIQLSPEAMDLFQAGVENNPNVLYQCTASYAPEPNLRQWSRAVLSPWRSLSAPIFSMLYRLTSLEHGMYPCSPGPSAEEALSAFHHAGRTPPARAPRHHPSAASRSAAAGSMTLDDLRLRVRRQPPMSRGVRDRESCFANGERGAGDAPRTRR